ncbi:hypothetical protein OUZ56_026463 [Daphnia magna]|uniref:Uncharacterized protein n=1 Tax=Daphnia magna TaxID=35525 RepID=A0ABQ9ZLW9_9CRUS|nr:hypothetical protein OUZ56_026463 [Daphnia magna]
MSWAEPDAPRVNESNPHRRSSKPWSPTTICDVLTGTLLSCSLGGVQRHCLQLRQRGESRESALIKPPLHHRHPLYAVYFTLLEIKRFARPTSSMWEVITAVCKDFLQWNQVSQSRKLIDVDEVMCCRMRDSRQCRGKAMDIIGLNTVALEVYPFV